MLRPAAAPSNQPSTPPTRTTRRRMLAGASGLLALAGLSACAGQAHPEPSRANESHPPQTPDEALSVLQAGNRRYAEGNPRHPGQDARARAEQAGHQTPFALVHGCVDSRVPPELLFDQGIGDLFVTRTAGTVLDDTLVGSMEFAVSSPYSVPLLVILAHSSCGAVTGTLEAMREDPQNPVLPGEMSDFAEQIIPVARAAKAGSAEPEQVEKVVQANALAVAEQLVQRSAIIRKAVEEQRTRVVPAVYDLATGQVRWL